MKTGCYLSKLDNNCASAYEKFLAKCPHALFYHSIQYKNFLKELLGCEEHYILAEKNGMIEAAFPLMSKQFPNGKVINSLPYFGSHGSILYQNSDHTDALINAYHTMIQEEDVISSTVITNPFASITEFPFQHHYTDYRMSQFTPLPVEGDRETIKEQLLKSFESSTRRNINKAIHSRIEISVDNQALDKLETMHRENISAKGGLCKSDRFFQLINKHFQPDADYRVFVARLDGEIIAALLLFYFKQTVEYFTPGINEEYRSLQPLALIIYEAMVHAATHGFTLWNWGGTWESQEGVFRFKKKWGSLSKNYRYFTQLNDQRLLKMTPDELTAQFQNFYVLPFSALKSEVAV